MKVTVESKRALKSKDQSQAWPRTDNTLPVDLNLRMCKDSYAAERSNIARAQSMIGLKGNQNYLKIDV